MRLDVTSSDPLQSGPLRLSATDLANHLGCSHLTRLEHARALGMIGAPDWREPTVNRW